MNDAKDFLFYESWYAETIFFCFENVVNEFIFKSKSNISQKFFDRCRRRCVDFFSIRRLHFVDSFINDKQLQFVDYFIDDWWFLTRSYYFQHLFSMLVYDISVFKSLLEIVRYFDQRDVIKYCRQILYCDCSIFVIF